MNYDEITKITAERISDYMTEAVNTDSIAVAEMFHNACCSPDCCSLTGNVS
ncbi:TPA: hypothetical protein ACWZTH_003909 [Escherichia coli]